MKVELQVVIKHKERVFVEEYVLALANLNNLKAHIQDVLEKHHAEDDVIQIKYSSSMEIAAMKNITAKQHKLYREE